MKWIKQAIALSVLALPAAAFAGSVTGSVKSIYVVSDGVTTGDLVYIELSGTKTSNPACSTKTPWQFLLPRNVIGDDFYADLLGFVQKAAAAGLTITVTGTGSCTVDYTLETISAVEF